MKVWHIKEKAKISSMMDKEFDSLRKSYIKCLKKNTKQRLRHNDSNILSDLDKVLEPSTVCSTADKAQMRLLLSWPIIVAMRKK